MHKKIYSFLIILGLGITFSSLSAMRGGEPLPKIEITTPTPEPREEEEEFLRHLEPHRSSSESGSFGKISPVSHPSARDTHSAPTSPTLQSGNFNDSDLALNSPDEELTTLTAQEKAALHTKQISFSAPVSRRQSPTSQELKQKELGTMIHIKNEVQKQFAQIKKEIEKQLEVARTALDKDNERTAKIKNIENLQKEVSKKERVWMQDISALESEIKTNARSSEAIEASLKELYFREMIFVITAEGEAARSFTKSPVTITYSIEFDKKKGSLLFARTERMIIPKK